MKCPSCGKKSREKEFSDSTTDSTEQPEVKFGKDYSTLFSIGKIISIIGWIIVLAGGVSALSLPFVEVGFGGEMGIMGFFMGLGIGISGILIVAGGQSISVMVSIERGIQDIKHELIKFNKGKQ